MHSFFVGQRKSWTMMRTTRTLEHATANFWIVCSLYSNFFVCLGLSRTRRTFWSLGVTEILSTFPRNQRRGQPDGRKTLSLSAHSLLLPISTHTLFAFVYLNSDEKPVPVPRIRIFGLPIDIHHIRSRGTVARKEPHSRLSAQIFPLTTLFWCTLWYGVFGIVPWGTYSRKFHFSRPSHTTTTTTASYVVYLFFKTRETHGYKK